MKEPKFWLCLNVAGKILHIAIRFFQLLELINQPEPNVISIFVTSALLVTTIFKTWRYILRLRKKQIEKKVDADRNQ